MSQSEKIALFFLRVGMGWYLFHAGVVKILDPTWTSAGFLSHTQFGFFNAFLSPSVLPIVDFLNEWGLTLIGLSFIFGVAVRVSSVFGALLLMLYYFAHGFPRPDEHTFIVNMHVIFSLVLLYLGKINAGEIMGLSSWIKKLPIFSNCPRFREWL